MLLVSLSHERNKPFQGKRMSELLAARGGDPVEVLFDVLLGRRFFKAPRLVLTIATIAAAGVFAGPIRTLITVLNGNVIYVSGYGDLENFETIALTLRPK